MQVQSFSAVRRRVSDSDVVETADDSFPPEPLDLLTETDLFGGLTLVPPPMRQSGSGTDSQPAAAQAHGICMTGLVRIAKHMCQRMQRLLQAVQQLCRSLTVLQPGLLHRWGRLRL